MRNDVFVFGQVFEIALLQPAQSVIERVFEVIVVVSIGPTHGSEDSFAFAEDGLGMLGRHTAVC